MNEYMCAFVLLFPLPPSQMTPYLPSGLRYLLNSGLKSGSSSSTSPRHQGITADNLQKHNNHRGQSLEEQYQQQLQQQQHGGSDVYNYGISGGNLPPMAAPLSARSITDCDSLFEELLRSGSMFSPMAGSVSGGTPYGYQSTSGLNGNTIANAANKERKESFEEFLSPKARPGKQSNSAAGGEEGAGGTSNCPPPVGLMRGNSTTRSGRASAVGSDEPPQPPALTSMISDAGCGSSRSTSSPTSRAMGMMRPMISEYEKILLQERISKRQQETKSQIHTGSYGVDEVIPLQMLPYFRWLNETAQRSLLKQLIERFQRTSYTPRYATISTPVHGMTIGLGDKDSNQDADLDPDCFDKFEGANHKSKSDDELKNNTVSNARTLGSSAAGEGKSDADTQDATSSSSDQLPCPPTQAPLLRDSSSATSMFDDAAIEAAVAVAMQLASHTSSAEQILQILTGNTNNNNNNSNDNDASTSNVESTHDDNAN